MSDGLTSAQLTVLCLMFVGLHLLAVPPFVWALRRGQFRGPKQAEWSLEDEETASVPAATTPLTPGKAAWMLGTLGAVFVLMLFSVVLTLFFAISAPAHPAAAGKCPF